MSYRSERFLRYHGESVPSLPYPIDDRSPVELRDLFLEILHNKVHGFCFSMYEEGQQPGDLIPEAQVRRRLQLLQRHAHWIRSFSCIEGNENVPKVARELGMNTLVGAWLGKDKEKNRQEIKALIDLARQGYVDIAAVGNEVLYRKDLSEDELLQYIDTVKQAIPEVQVGYVDAYYEFVQRPSIAAACDVILTNCYPFWEGTSFETSLDHMKQMYGQAREAGGGKRVIITETGWPSRGASLGIALPSARNALLYFINTQLWSMDENIEVFYFSSFDESWKTGAEGEVGAFWGVWDIHGNLKYTGEQL
ncbi:MAG TPA: glycosyl hydrolase family 17 protein [Bacteroidales bacterium]|nr:glycosyl hydrolase family 17 protein [Bacteroidales bacterium]HRZ78186.1 glycosyl hydrolase family 17 protein [Bacteroidales bacterium]